MRMNKWICLMVSVCCLGCLPKEERRATSDTAEQAYVSEKDLSDIRVGYCSPTMSAPFYVALEQAVKTSAAAYGMQYISTDGQGDIAKQVMAVEDLLSKGVQVLILN